MRSGLRSCARGYGRLNRGFQTSAAFQDRLSMQTSTWKGRLESKRRGKDRFFRDDPRSPIPPADREEFQGLAYFPLDVTYRLDLPLREYGEKERVVLEASHEGKQEFLR
jgi:uncharacterized protein (DUF1684 family)